MSPKDIPDNPESVEELSVSKDKKRGGDTYIPFSKEFQDSLLSIVTQLSLKILELDERVIALEGQVEANHNLVPKTDGS